MAASPPAAAGAWILVQQASGVRKAKRKGKPQKIPYIKKGELLFEIPLKDRVKQEADKPPHNYALLRDPEVTLYDSGVNVVPLIGPEADYLKGVKDPHDRYLEHRKDDRMRWIMGLRIGEMVYFKLETDKGSKVPALTTQGRIKWYGVKDGETGVNFGIEITEPEHRGKGTTNGYPYFKCNHRDGVFVSMDKIIEKVERSLVNRENELENFIDQQPTADGPPAEKTRSKEKKETWYNRAINKVDKAISRFSEAAQGEMLNPSDSHQSKFSPGDLVVVQTVHGRAVTGTVRWVGSIRAADNVTVPAVVGIEVNEIVIPTVDFPDIHMDVTGSHRRDLFPVASGHSRLFLPEVLVLYPDEYDKHKQESNTFEAQEAKKWGIEVDEYREQIDELKKRESERQREFVEQRKKHEEQQEVNTLGIIDECRTEDDLKEQLLEKLNDPRRPKNAYEECVGMIISRNVLFDENKALILVRLLENNSDYPMKYYIDAAKHYDNFEDALKFMNQPCPICTDIFIMDDMVVMPACGDALCKNCFSAHFSLTIKKKSVKHFNCPICGEPDLSNPNESLDMNLELFLALVKEFLEKEDYDLCQQMLTDFNLSKQPNFVWCINEKCRSVFLTDHVDRIRAKCPHCHHDMCFICKRKWEHQHEGLTCDQFTQWKIDNDPEAQKQGLAAHLEEHGIQCPGCKFRYGVARGGNIHFRCIQCPVEFCSGCYGIIKKGEDCGKFEACKRLGLHAHHPRDCLFYLRDFTVADLQTLLTANNVEFDQDPPQAQVDAAREKKEGEDGDDEQVAAPIVEDIEEEQDRGDDVQPAPGPVALKCCVMLQKEGPEGLYDEECGAISPDKMAGLCETHYKEYLVSKINKHKLDPSELYPIHQLKRILEREEKEVPEKNLEDDESDEDYKQRLIELIGNELPIQQKEDAIKPDM